MRTKRHGVPNLGERISRLMETANLNASELSARTSISVSYLTRIIRGEVVNPTIDFVSRIASGLGVTETELLREDVQAGVPVKIAANQSEKSKQQADSTLMPTTANLSMTLPNILLGARAQEIQRLIASAGLEEEEEKQVFTDLVGITKYLLWRIEMQRKMQKDG
jgi:transcriptional regulator with XRE-family HTH domain